MIKFALGVVIAATVATAASAEAPDRFTLDGCTYTYTTTTNDRGETVLTGKASPGGDFTFVVRNGIVSGDIAGQPVSFNTSEARGAARRARFVVASRDRTDQSVALAGN